MYKDNFYICCQIAPSREVLPTFINTPPTMDVHLNQVLFWPFPPNVNFRNHEVAKDPPTGCGVLRGKISCDCPLGSRLSGCSPHDISLMEGVSSWGTQFGASGFELWANWGHPERSECHPQVDLRTPSWQQKELCEEMGPSTHFGDILDWHVTPWAPWLLLG